MQTESIQLLPEHIIDQIKAGEVIERPSTLIKEILENAIDAGATKLDLHIIENGLELISLMDNGKGIDAEELPLAFCRHATSKIDRFEDIYHLNSYGFRGEALASIASVSRVSCESKTTASSGQINIEGGQTVHHFHQDKKNTDTGTKIFIKDLFFNTPVRMKFIQSKSAEKNQIKKIIHSFMINHFDKEFSIKWDQKEKEIYLKREHQVERLKDVLFAGKNIEFEQISAQYDGIDVQLFLSHESSRGNAHKSHFLFVNDRYIKEIPIHKVILNTAAPLWPEGETGHYVCLIKIPADEIDVNIHPNKTVIKFFRLNKVLSLLSGAIRAHLVPKQTRPIASERQDDLLPQSLGEREVQYREVNFNLKEETASYFENIHYQTEENHQSRLLLQDETSLLFQKEQKLYFLNKELLCNYHIRKILSSIDQQKVSPLLVSKPLKIDGALNESKIKQALDYGFEIDALDQETFVARTFYMPLQIYPYLTIIEALINQNFAMETINFYQSFSEFHLSAPLLREILGELNLAKLIEQNIMRELSLSNLKKIYAK